VHTGFWWGNRRERDQLEDLSVDGRIILKRVLTKSIVSGQGKVSGSCEDRD
jgi:hypothetical protein